MNFPSKTASTTSKKTSHAPAPRTFWKFGADFHGDETIRAEATDFVLFTVIALVCAWPILSAAVAIARVFTGH